MTVTPLRVLLVEDDPAYAALIAHELESSPVQLRHVRCLAEARRELCAHSYDAVLLDLALPDSAGLSTIESIHLTDADVPVVILTSHEDDWLAVTSMQRGAHDYLLKAESDNATILRALRHARDRAEFRRTMRDGESRFRALVENSYDVITLVDEHYNILYDSRSITRITGYTPEERLGRGVAGFLHPDDVERIAERFSYCLDHPDEVLHAEFRFLHRDGTYRWGEATGVNRLSDPTVAAIVVNHRDITERRLMQEALRHSEDQLRQAQKMEAVGRLAGGVAHDFNNVLTAIFGYTDLLLEQFTEDDVRRADVEEIRKSAERAATLTRQLLAFSRKQVMQPRELDLNAVIWSLEKLLARLVGEDMQLRLDLQADLHTVRADPGQIEQVLMNLAANARDAMPEGGTLRIATANVSVDEERLLRPGLKAGDYATLSVRDQGTGMPTDVRAHIFEPFFTTKDQGKGTGLGLATVYGIVKQSGGGIYVESEAGQGTTFVIYLPRVITSSP
jgi:two-component system, cell cycle sensor histidine kinase and response regulator CckA